MTMSINEKYLIFLDTIEQRGYFVYPDIIHRLVEHYPELTLKRADKIVEYWHDHRAGFGVTDWQ